jgi:predicted adenylyl cyclase CyaB
VRITYKGPGSTQVKVRREIELPVGRSADDAATVEELLMLLGFTPVRAVKKIRVPHRLEWEGKTLEVTLDTVTDLGTYLEIEGMAEELSGNGDAILRLRLDESERKSYLRAGERA